MQTASPPASSRRDRLRACRSYSYTASPQEIEADLAIMQVLSAKRSLLLKRLTWAQRGLVVVLLLVVLRILLMMSSKARVDAKAEFLAAAVALGAWCILKIFRPGPLSTPWKLDSASRIVRRVFFGPSAPVSLRADFGMGLHQLERKVHGASWSDYGNLVTTNAAMQFELEGTLVNGTYLRVSRTMVLFTSARVRQAVQRTDQFCDTVALSYLPQANPQPSQLGSTVTQYLRLGPEVTLEVLDNRPGILALRSMRPVATGSVDATALANLIAQMAALVDRSTQVVRIDNESWPAYQPSSADLGGL